MHQYKRAFVLSENCYRGVYLFIGAHTGRDERRFALFRNGPQKIIMSDHRRSNLVILEVKLPQEYLTRHIPRGCEPINSLLSAIPINLVIFCLAKLKTLLLCALRRAP